MKDAGFILEIKGNSLDDGPGIRSVLFFKGCPLNCAWCHNPESKKMGQELAFYSEKCAGCDTCIKTCPEKAIAKKNKYYIQRTLCTLCMKCTDSCPSGALVPVGKTIVVADILRQILKDKPFFNTSGGGVTLSGGEATLAMPYLEGLLKELRAEEINILLETCGFFNYDNFMKQMYPYLDTIYYDIKLIDNEKHKQYCGASNRLILENFAKLYEKSLQGGVPVLPRTPLVPDITDTAENIRATAEFYKGHGVKQASLLNYNPLWHEKNMSLGIDNPFSADKKMRLWLAKEKIQDCNRIMTEAGIAVV